MFQAELIRKDGELFATKGAARPTPDYVPMLKTEAPARLAADEAAPGPPPEPQPLAGADPALGGLIRRLPAPRAPDPEALAAAEAAARAERDSAALAGTVAEQVDNGMLYESLRMGLPMPDFSAAKTVAEGGVPGEPTTFQEAARRYLVRPRAGAGDRAGAANRGPRRKLTVRLESDDFRRLKTHAGEAGRTYQDVLATAANLYLDSLAEPGAHATAAPPRRGLLSGLFRRRR